MTRDGLPPCRLSLVFASETPIAVILRRGPSDRVEVIKWNTSTDSFETGQWLHGKIYGERCGLSPDGQLLVYFAAKFGKIGKTRKAEGYESTFTAVSKPPFLTALALWPQGNTWGGGGRFIDNTTLRLAYGADGTRVPRYGHTELFMSSLPKHHPDHSPGPLRIQTDLDRYVADCDFKVDSAGYPEAEWTGKDHNARAIFTRKGALYALVNGQEYVLRDFNPDIPTEVISPEWARVW